MKLSMEAFNQKLVEYTLGTLIPNAKEKKTKFMLGFAVGAGALGISEDKAKMLKAIGVIDDADNVDLDLLKAGLYKGVEIAGEVPFGPFGLYRPEVDGFFSFIATGAVG